MSYLVTASSGGDTCTVTGPSGSCPVTGLTDGEKLDVHVHRHQRRRHVRSVAPSAAVIAGARPGHSGQPTAVGGDATATVTVVAPTAGGSPASYLVTASPGGQTCPVTGASGSCVVSDLTDGDPYTFTATATNAGGTSDPSPPSAAVIPQVIVPGTPGQPTAVGGDTTATVTVVAPTAGGSPASYLVTASPGGETCPVSGASGSCVVSDLTDGDPYTFTATATNAGGTSDPSSPSTPVTPQVPAPVVTDISPGFGPQAGGTTVTFTGTGFTAAIAVDFGSCPGH